MQLATGEDTTFKSSDNGFPLSCWFGVSMNEDETKKNPLKIVKLDKVWAPANLIVATHSARTIVIKIEKWFQLKAGNERIHILNESIMKI